jgi:aromatic-L-amino-acid decarboxylase
MDELLFTDEEHRNWASRTQAFADGYLAGIRERRVAGAPDRPALRAIVDAPLPRESQSLEALFEELEQVLVPNATHTAHPRFLPYVQPSPNGLSPYAEMVSAVLNQNCNLWHLSPAANAVEQAVVRWFAALFGLPTTAGGIVASGGSMANLIALTAARDDRLGASARTDGLQGTRPPLVAYTSDEVHSSVDKAISMLGLGTRHLRHVGTDAAFRMRIDLLEQAVARDRAAGLEPFCVIASAGTVTTGAVDPLDALADFCAREGLWLHVDGAYGALSALSPRFRERLSGIGRADSISLDPHKFLFCSFEAGCVLVRNRATLRHAFHAAPSYLTMTEDPDFVDFANYGPQLSRGFKAFKVWWSLKHFGADRYADTIDRLADLSMWMGEEIGRRSELELLAPVVFNCVCFRVRGRSDDDNASILKALVDSGDAFIGPANVKGERGMRACFMNLRTTREDIAFLLDRVEQEAARLAP